MLAWLREQAGRQPVAVVDDGPERGKRIRNARLRASGWAPRYPDFRAGYGPLLGTGV